MSGIYIGNVSKPKSCRSCHFTYKTWTGRKECLFAGRYVDILCEDELLSDCPIVEVPDHGPLIDVDIAKDRLNRCMEECKFAKYSLQWHLIDHALSMLDIEITGAILPSDKEVMKPCP